MLRPDDEGSISGGMSCMGRSGTLTSPQVQSQSPERKQDRVTHVRWHTSSRSVIWYRAIRGVMEKSVVVFARVWTSQGVPSPFSDASAPKAHKAQHGLVKEQGVLKNM